MASIPHVVEVTTLRGAAAAEDAVPELLLEVPHGATRAEHFRTLRAELRGPFPPDLEAFFFANTDVGAPEVALRVAERVVAAAPKRSVLVVRSLIPRTFIDCNRVIDVGARESSSAVGEMTPGVLPYVKTPEDLALLLERYGAYRRLATEAFARVCGGGGLALMLHTYAPRSVDVPVDERIVERLRAAYAPERVGTWPLRAEVDLIAHDPEGEQLASTELLRRVGRAFRASGAQVEEDAAYTLHPSTLAHVFARAHPERTLCLELRRDLLVREFTPFQEMSVDSAKIDRVATILASALT